ncbi:unnamed protein product, partial [Didymodactylos carnosus]
MRRMPFLTRIYQAFKELIATEVVEIEEATTIYNSNDNFISDKTRFQKISNEIKIPCEFCGDLYEFEDIVQHQSGCGAAPLPYDKNFDCSVNKNSFLSPDKFNDFQQQRTWTIITEPLQNQVPQKALSLEQTIETIAECITSLPCEFCRVKMSPTCLDIHEVFCDQNPRNQQRNAVMTE